MISVLNTGNSLQGCGWGHPGRFYHTGVGGSGSCRSRAGGGEWVELGGRSSRVGCQLHVACEGRSRDDSQVFDLRD